MYRLFRRLKTLFRRRQHEQDLQDELAAHLAMDTKERMESGEQPGSAREAARRDFGNVARISEETRETWGWMGFEQSMQDLRYAARSAVRSPGFTAVAVLTLALAIGATTAIFSFVYSAFLRPLPYERPDRLVRLFESGTAPISAPNFLDWKEQNRVFERIAAFQQAPRTIQTPDGPEQAGGMQVSADFFSVLGIEPIHGRDFLPEEDRPGASAVVIVSHEFWQAQLAGDPGVIGRPVQLNGENVIVIGILPPGFRFSAREAGLWMPLGLGGAGPGTQSSERYLQAIGRLRAGITLAQAQVEMDALAKRIASETRRDDFMPGADVVSLQENLVGNLRVSFLVLSGASAFVLLIGVSNLTNLLLARSLAREREITIRFALGARRFRIMRQLIAEASLIGLLGGIGGTLIAIWAIEAALPLLSGIGGSYAFVVSRMMDAAVDRRALLFGIALSMAAAVFCAIVSAIYATRSDLHHVLQQGGRGAIGSTHRARLRSALVVAEISLTFVLLAGAGLLLNSFWRLRQVDLGFEPELVLTMRLYSSPQESIDFYRNVIEGVRALPDIESASVVSSLPLLGADMVTGFVIEDRPPDSFQQRPRAIAKVVGDRYFQTMRIPLVEGRYFNERDTEGSETVVIINEAMAREHWPGTNPVGRRIQRGGPDRPWNTIVGVVRDVKVGGPDKETPAEVYIPHSQFLLARDSRLAIPNMTLVVRTAFEPARSIPALRGQIRALDKAALITNIATMEEALSRVVAPRALNTVLLGAFAFTALSLAIVGIYGVMSYSVTRRRQEIGVRVALGAQRREVLLLVLRQGFRLVLPGVTIGLAGAVVMTRWMSALLFEVGPMDPITLAAMVTIVLVVSLIACYVPARRAVKTDPLAALRAE